MNTKTVKKMPSGYGMVQTSIMKMKGLTIQAKAIYALLASYTGSNEYCFPSLETIGNDMDLSRPMIIKYLKELENIGLIRKTKLYPDNKMKKHNKYEIMFLEESRCKVDLTSNVKQDLHRTSNVLNTGCKTDLTQNINSINIKINNKSDKKDFEKIIKEKLKNCTPETLQEVLNYALGKDKLKTARGNKAWGLVEKNL